MLKELFVDYTKKIFLDYSERMLLALFVLSVFIFTGWFVSSLLRRLGKRKTVQANRVYRLIAGSINTVIVGAGAISALGTVGVNITALVAGLGLTGFALGLALKDAISNLVAGLMVIVYAPFYLGDTIDVSGIRGKVIDINLRYVTLETDSETVLIPNNNFITSTIRKVLADQLPDQKDRNHHCS